MSKTDKIKLVMTFDRGQFEECGAEINQIVCDFHMIPPLTADQTFELKYHLDIPYWAEGIAKLKAVLALHDSGIRVEASPETVDEVSYIIRQVADLVEALANIVVAPENYRSCSECGESDWEIKEQIDYDCGGNKGSEDYLECAQCGDTVWPEDFTAEDWSYIKRKNALR